jgi:hypothetical protein
MPKTIASIIIFLLPLFVLSQRLQQKYIYPVKHGTVAWDTITSYADRRSACQIPAPLIARMTTGTLLESILDYPLLGDLHLFSSFQEGFEKARVHFYAIDSLLNRPDLANAFLQAYTKQDPLEVNKRKNVFDIGSYMLTFSFLEMLGAQNELLSRLDASRKTAFTAALINTYEVKSKAVDKYGTLGLSTTSWTLSQIMNLEETIPAGFREKGFQLETKTLHAIKAKADAIN